MNNELNYKAAGFKYFSRDEMYACGTVKCMKNSGFSLEKCLEYFKHINNFHNITTEDRIRDFYSDEFIL